MVEKLDDLIEVIDRLIDDELARGPRYDNAGQPRCELCNGDWHGLGRTEGCPGAFATDGQRDAWLNTGGGRAAPGVRRCVDYLCDFQPPMCGKDACTGMLYRRPNWPAPAPRGSETS